MSLRGIALSRTRKQNGHWQSGRRPEEEEEGILWSSGPKYTGTNQVLNISTDKDLDMDNLVIGIIYENVNAGIPGAGSTFANSAININSNYMGIPNSQRIDYNGTIYLMSWLYSSQNGGSNISIQNNGYAFGSGTYAADRYSLKAQENWSTNDVIFSNIATGKWSNSINNDGSFTYYYKISMNSGHTLKLKPDYINGVTVTTLRAAPTSTTYFKIFVARNSYPTKYDLTEVQTL